MPLGGRLELRLTAWGRDLVEKLRVLVLEVDRLRALGLAISSLLTAEIFDGPDLGDCGETTTAPPPFPLDEEEERDPARVRLRPLLGMAPLRLSPLSREKQS